MQCLPGLSVGLGFGPIALNSRIRSKELSTYDEGARRG